jgi:hypothetical protein
VISQVRFLNIAMMAGIKHMMLMMMQVDGFIVGKVVKIKSPTMPDVDGLEICMKR